MIRKEWIYRAMMAATSAVILQGCGYPISRMPPTDPSAYAMAPATAPVAAQPQAPVYNAPYAAAAAAAPYTPPVAAAPVAAELPAQATGITGLTERQPDLCGASKYASNIGQPGSIIPTLGVTKTFRVVEYRGIEPQEYDPNRIVFRLDSLGNISKIDCG